MIPSSMVWACNEPVRSATNPRTETIFGTAKETTFRRMSQYDGAISSTTLTGTQYARRRAAVSLLAWSWRDRGTARSMNGRQWPLMAFARLSVRGLDDVTNVVFYEDPVATQRSTPSMPFTNAYSVIMLATTNNA